MSDLPIPNYELADTTSAIRQGVRIAVDVGEVRVGIARTDTFGIMSLPVGTFRREADDFTAVQQLCKEYDVLEIYVGLPLNMDGSEGKSAKNARRWAKRMQRRIKTTPIRLIDERLTTITAHKKLHEAGRREITHRKVVDQVAASVILDNALDYERHTGKVPGISLEGTRS